MEQPTLVYTHRCLFKANLGGRAKQINELPQWRPLYAERLKLQQSLTSTGQSLKTIHRWTLIVCRRNLSQNIWTYLWEIL